MRGYYFITDNTLSRAGTFNDVQNAVAAGVEVIQYRVKNLSAKEMCEEAGVLRSLCQRILFLVNDRVDVSQAVSADGVHLGQDDIPCVEARKILGKHKIIGITVHTVEEAEAAYTSGADYLGVAPIFKTTTKSDTGQPQGITLIQEIRKVVPLPLVAIGGITLPNAPLVIAAGADAVCAVSAVVTAEDVKNEIEKFQRLFTLPHKS